MDVRGTQTEFACAGFEDDAASIEVLELLSYLQGAIRRAVVDDDYFPVEFAGRARGLAGCNGGGGGLVRGGLVERGNYYLSVKVRLRSQVTMRVYISMGTKKQRQLKFQLGVSH